MIFQNYINIWPHLMLSSKKQTMHIYTKASSESIFDSTKPAHSISSDRRKNLKKRERETSVCRRLRWSWFTSSAGHKNGAAGWEISSLVACSISLSPRALIIFAPKVASKYIYIDGVEHGTVDWRRSNQQQPRAPIHLSRRLMLMLLSHSLLVFRIAND